MPVYCLDADLIKELPLPVPVEMTSSYRTTQMSAASSVVDGLVGTNFSLSYNSASQRFPEIGSSPNTPQIIQLCAIWLAASYCWNNAFTTNRLSVDTKVSPDERLREMAYDMLSMIRSGEMGITLSDGTELGPISTSSDPVNYSEEGVIADITKGRYDSSGNNMDDLAGSLDGF